MPFAAFKHRVTQMNITMFMDQSRTLAALKKAVTEL